MRIRTKIALTAALLVVFALPLLLWGQTASSRRGGHIDEVDPRPTYNSLDRAVNLW